MNLVMVYLYNEDHLTDLVLAIAQVFENRAVVTDAMAESDQLAANIPIFADFSSASGGRTYCKVIHTITQVAEPIPPLVAALQEAGIDFRREQLGAICVLPLKDCLVAEMEP
jgi:hypothetical protein